MITWHARHGRGPGFATHGMTAPRPHAFKWAPPCYQERVGHAMHARRVTLGLALVCKPGPQPMTGQPVCQCCVLAPGRHATSGCLLGSRVQDPSVQGPLPERMRWAAGGARRAGEPGGGGRVGEWHHRQPAAGRRVARYLTQPVAVCAQSLDYLHVFRVCFFGEASSSGRWPCLPAACCIAQGGRVGGLP